MAERRPRHADAATDEAPGNARQAAWRILGRLSYRPYEARSLLDQELARGHWSGPERGLLTELVYGTVKRRLTLDSVLRAYVSRPWAAVETPVADLLRLAAYQILLLERVPRHAVVNETVELAGRVGLGQARHFVNGVLRALCADVGPNLADEPSVGAVPVHSGRWRPMGRDVFAGLAPDSALYLSRAYSFPLWMVERWLARVPAEEVRRWGDYFNAPPRLWLRVNRARAAREQVLEALAAAGVAAQPGPHPDSIQVLDRAVPRDLPGFREGWWLVQDHAAMEVVRLAAPEPGWRVLDVCAAPGGKTTHLAALVGQGGQVVACDVRSEGLQQVRDNCARLGLENVECVHVQQEDGSDLPAGPFDAILVDAPCSNTGVLGRRPEARWRGGPEDIARLAALQTRLLQTAAQRLRPGGVLVYSTCSLEPEENAGVVGAVTAACDNLRYEQAAAFVPGRPGDGGWAARLSV